MLCEKVKSYSNSGAASIFDPLNLCGVKYSACDVGKSLKEMLPTAGR